MKKKRILSVLLVLSLMAAFFPAISLEAYAQTPSDSCHTWNCGTVTKAATCTEPGVMTYTCVICCATKTETIEPLGHSYGDWQNWNDDCHRRVCSRDPSHIQVAYHVWSNVNTKCASTCTTSGEIVSSCAVCSATKTETVNPLGHCFGNWQKLDDTYHQRVCSRNASHTQKEKHTWNCGTVTTAATCTSAGSITYTCTTCCATKTEAINPLGHCYGNWQKLNDDYHQRVCSRDSSHTQKAEHTWNCGTVTKAATCTSAGTITYTCTVCGGTKTAAINPLDHAYGNWQYLNISFHRRVCARDASHKLDAYHTWDGGKVTKAATCAAPGVKTYTCTVCGGTKTETITTQEHSYGDWQRLNDASHQRVCSVDPSHKQIAYHVWDKGTVTKAATCAAPGVKTYTCAVCGATKTEEIPRLSDEPAANPEPVADPSLVLAAATVSAAPGETVTVPVAISKAAAVSFISLNVQYDTSVLKLEKAEKGSLFEGFEQGGDFIFDSGSDVNKTGTLVTLTFKVCSAAKAGSYAISLTGTAYNKCEKEVTVKTIAGAVKVSASLFGDVNNDQSVDGRDLIRLRKYLANLNEATGSCAVTICANADVNGDGKVDGRDLIRLRKYLANMNEKTGKCDVVLGS